MPTIAPSDFHRIVDATIGPLRFFERERERCLRYTNGLYGRVCQPKQEFILSFATALRETIERTHRIRSCRPDSCGVTIQFPDLPPTPDYKHLLAGEIVVHLPESRDKFTRTISNGKVRPDFPWVQWRRPGDSMVFRRRQISPRETPERILARCLHYFDCHRLDTIVTAAAA